ncbi:MAG: type II secretion system F family protein [Candidatus Thermoplasmatota archaeon]|jgi:flagellar protein FlaJ|nr:type II secretion system F family protein [Candidatus Thermoplasmatota archaeon]
MIAEKKKKLRLRKKEPIDKDKKKREFIKQLRIAYKNLDDPKKYKRNILLPLIILGALVFCLPFILESIIGMPLDLNPVTFIVGGIVPIFLGILYPYISWKNKENDINGKMHYFITHLRVLAISDMSLKDIIKVIGGKKVYGSLGKEIEKASILSTQWKVPLARSFKFVSDRTPSKILKDFLDRFAQSIASGVDHREFIETEQNAVLQEYKTMYETANENIVIINEVYTGLLISIIFIMSLGIVLPIIMGGWDMNTYLFLSAFLLIISEGMLLYLLRSMIPRDEVWHQSGEKSATELRLWKSFKISVIACIVIGVVLFFGKYRLDIPVLGIIPFEIIAAISLTPLLIPGLETLKAESDITRKEKSFLGFLPALGSISTMRGGKINDSVYYLSEKDYGVLTHHIRDLYRRLRTRINDDSAWEWFGVDTGSNHIQRSSEMFREATYAAANPRTASRMIAENIRKIRDLRIKKFSIIGTSASLFAGITFGVAFSIYVSLVIARHLNNLVLEENVGNPFESIGTSAILTAMPPETFVNAFLIIFIVLVIHCLIMSLTIRVLRDSHILVTLAYFIPFVWIIAITAVLVDIVLTGVLVV